MHILILGGARRGLRGVFNVTGEPMSFVHLLDLCLAETGGRDAVLQWVPTPRLLAAGVDPWMGVPAAHADRPGGSAEP